MKSIHIRCSDKLTEAACQKLIQQLLADKIDVLTATFTTDGPKAAALIGDPSELVDTSAMSERREKSSADRKESVTLESLDLKLTALLDELRVQRAAEDDDDKKTKRARSKPKLEKTEVPAAPAAASAPAEGALQIPSTEGVKAPEPEAADIEGPAPDLSERTENRADDKAPEPQA